MPVNLVGEKLTIVSSISTDSLLGYVIKQCNNFFPDNNPLTYRDLNSVLNITVDRLQKCFSKIITTYFRYEGQPYFNHLHGDHYSMFLYLLSNTCYKTTGNDAVASKIFLLNKMLFGIDAFYKIELPEIFMFVHPVGTILGRANYQNYFVVYQGVTVGATTDLIYATFSESAILYSNTAIIGDCKLGSNVVLAANSSIVNTCIESNKVVVGNYPNNRFINNNNNLISKYFLL